jgi:indoleamine 2,3-dioxygenase
MPILDVPQASLPLLRRAHLVLSFLLHFYVHTTPPSARTTALPIPPSIAVPIVTVSNLLGLPPVVTYSDTVLYNFLPNQPALPVSISNIPTRCIESFTNTRSEEQFYVVSAQCEIAGAEALRLMRRSLDELFLADDVALKRLSSYLRKLAVQIDLIGDITLSMIQNVDPEEFYHLIRPWFRGGDADGPNSLGWEFQGIEAGSTAESGRTGTGATLFSGPSAGQSSLIHAIDIFLTVDHAPTPDEGIVLDAEPIGSSKPNEATFVQRMLQYMPQQHRSFLLHLASQPTSLRQLVASCAETHPKLVASYDAALEALKRFREKHMRVVSIFIVQQARRQPSERIQELIGEVEAPVGELRGTGGSPLFKFLKRCRDNTTKAMIGKPAGPGFELA